MLEVSSHIVPASSHIVLAASYICKLTSVVTIAHNDKNVN